MRPRALAAALAVLAAAACSSAASSSPAVASAPEGSADERSGVERRPGDTETGKASYYSDRLAGRRTANGERYDPGALTAAHRRLPFGSVVEVTRRDGRRVLVRINDRGPFGGKGRIVDLSRRAAEAIGLLKEGVSEVTLRVISVPRPRGKSASAPRGETAP